MKTINLFLKAHFTSLSPDGQFISLAIVTGSKKKYPVGIVSNGLKEARIYAGGHGLNIRNPSECILISRPEHICSRVFSEIIILENTHISENMGVYIDIAQNTQIEPIIESKSFYAEFSDFDINRCDDWVKENVISKLNINFKYNDPREGVDCMSTLGYNWKVKGQDSGIKVELSRWLSQFSDYKLNFIVDCGWFCWGKFVELMGEWEEKPMDYCNRCGYNGDEDILLLGIPKLPANFPPLPQDLNELIAQKKGVSVSEAFELDRELLGLGFTDNEVRKCIAKFKKDELAAFGFNGETIYDGKFNALFDAKVTKAIYEKLS